MNTMEHGGALAVARVKRLMAEARSRIVSLERQGPKDSSAGVTEGNTSAVPSRQNDPGPSRQH